MHWHQQEDWVPFPPWGFLFAPSAAVCCSSDCTVQLVEDLCGKATSLKRISSWRWIRARKLLNQLCCCSQHIVQHALRLQLHVQSWHLCRLLLKGTVLLSFVLLARELVWLCSGLEELLLPFQLLLEVSCPFFFPSPSPIKSSSLSWPHAWLPKCWCWQKGEAEMWGPGCFFPLSACAFVAAWWQ